MEVLEEEVENSAALSVEERETKQKSQFFRMTVFGGGYCDLTPQEAAEVAILLIGNAWRPAIPMRVFCVDYLLNLLFLFGNDLEVPNLFRKVADSYNVGARQGDVSMLADIKRVADSENEDRLLSFAAPHTAFGEAVRYFFSLPTYPSSRELAEWSRQQALLLLPLAETQLSFVGQELSIFLPGDQEEKFTAEPEGERRTPGVIVWE